LSVLIIAQMTLDARVMELLNTVPGYCYTYRTS